MSVYSALVSYVDNGMRPCEHDMLISCDCGKPSCLAKAVRAAIVDRGIQLVSVGGVALRRLDGELVATAVREPIAGLVWTWEK